ncbi:MAG: hypothetical protein IH953_00605 [Chloroflexi bacterium]|nr:hypothetical protein [Chloroflexota bacterium]
MPLVSALAPVLIRRLLQRRFASLVAGRAALGRAARFELRVRGLDRVIEAIEQVRTAGSVVAAARARKRLTKAQGEVVIEPGTRGLSWAIEQVGKDVLRTSGSMTHVDTGALRASHRMELSSKGKTARARIFIDPSAANPRTGRRVAKYGFYEHARGGSHAFYGRTFDFYRRGGGRRFLKYILQQLPKG